MAMNVDLKCSDLDSVQSRENATRISQWRAPLDYFFAIVLLKIDGGRMEEDTSNLSFRLNYSSNKLVKN